MESILLELVVIFLLILANGFFAGSELAIISARKSTIVRLISEGDSRAKVVENLQNDPHRFLATVQIGVTVVGSMASAVGGATAVEYLSPVLSASPFEFVRKVSEPLSIGLVVLIVSYFSLILGELAPKTIGLQFADRMSLMVAKPINFIAVVGGIAVKFLTLSNRAVLAIMGIKPESGQAFVTREEIRHTVSEGGETGALSKLEQKIITNMFEFSHTVVREVMVPRIRMTGIDINLPLDEIIKIVKNSMYTRYPVYDGSIENILGFIHSKDLFLGRIGEEHAIDLKNILRPSYFVPESKKASDLLREMQQLRKHMALVVDEYGGISGLVTTEDLLEELVGEIEDEHDVGDLRHAVRLADGSIVVDGLISIKDLEEVLNIDVGDNLQYGTLAGLILAELGRFPEKGEQLQWKDYAIICKEVTNTAIVKVKIKKSDL